jgi:hypothetical protein
MKSTDQLKAIFDDSKRRAGGIVFYRDDGTVRGIHPTTPGSANSFSLRQLQTAAKVAAEYGLTINERTAQKEIPVSAAIAERSRVAQAGAHILVVDPAAEAKPVGEGTGVLGFSYVPREFVTIAPAPFAPIAEPDPEVPESDSPVSRIKFCYHGGASQGFAGPSYAVRFKLQRAETREVHGGEGRLLEELLQSITMGLARAADHALLSAIVASAPAPFTLAAAAAAGLEFSQLRALVGTTGAAAAVGQDGALRAAGVAAELTSEMAPTLVGSFGSVGLAINDSLRIHVLQAGLNGDAMVTCWADFQPLLPEQSFLWTAA